MYKIGDFSLKTNVSIKTLRYYDEIGLLKPTYTDIYTNYRYYEKKDLTRIKKITQLKDLGLSLKEIKKYLETQDITLLQTRERELIMKAEKIKNYITEEKITINKGTYEDYIYWNGKRSENKPISLEIKNNDCDYYIVFIDDEYYDEIYVFNKENNLINLNINILPFHEHFLYIMRYLKRLYSQVTFKIDEKAYNTNIVENIRKNYKIVDEFDEVINSNGLEYRLKTIVVEF